MTEGDRQPVSFCSALSLVSPFFTLEIGISAFSLMAGSFLMLCPVNTGSMLAVCDFIEWCTGWPLAYDFTIFGVLGSSLALLFRFCFPAG